MGLREKKAARTRACIRDAAMQLFIEKGYDATTVEEIAEAAEVGSSTVYRFYGSKESILMADIPRHGIARALRERGAQRPDEPIETALAHAIQAALAESNEQILVIRDILDRSPGPRAALWDIVGEDAVFLQETLAERMGKDPADLGVYLTATLAIIIHSRAADQWRADPRAANVTQIGDSILAALAETTVIIPRL
ncbi:MAG: TetR/AcrR family transcriptional regulator [Propionibacteriaceae bacterium]|jgi:AcrR family transcriptional regulator|nr:TetR/AcrR family transcriptional regulator [Propionibacteriaceae bacterium]